VLLLTVQREVALKGSSVSREQNNLLVVRKFMTQNGCFTFCPHSCIYVFCVDLRTNSNYFLFNINWLVFITEMQCVYCAVRTGYIGTSQVESQLSKG